MPVLSSYRNHQLICAANQSTGFFMRATLEFNGLITINPFYGTSLFLYPLKTSENIKTSITVPVFHHWFKVRCSQLIVSLHFIFFLFLFKYFSWCCYWFFVPSSDRILLQVVVSFPSKLVYVMVGVILCSYSFNFMLWR